MPYLNTRLSAVAVFLLAGCATFTASQNNKPNAEQAAASGPRPSSYTTSWSGNQAAKRPPQDNAGPAGAGAAAADSERRIQELLASAERSQDAGDRRAARTAYEQVLRLAPGDAGANYQLAIMDDGDGRFAEAETHYFIVMRQTPNDPNLLSSLGWSYFLNGRYEDSDRVLREALRYDPNNKFALNNLGMLYGARGDYDGALTIFRMAGSEADALKALALLKQNAGAMPVAGEQYANAPVNSAVQAGGSVAGNNVDSPSGKGSDEPEFKTPQARKFAEDYKRLKAENDKREQEKRARLAQKNMSAPSPWSNSRPTDASSGQRGAGPDMPVQGLVLSRDYDRLPPNAAAYPGVAPSQANRPRQADPADFGPVGNAPGSRGNIPPFKPGAQAFPGTQAIYEQPAAPRSDGQARSPIITPSGDSPASRGGNVPTWNSLPRDDSYRGSPNGGQPRGNTSNQDAQAAAAQLGLSAGAGGLSFPAPDWPASSNGQTANPSNGTNPAGGGNFPDGQVPPGNQNPFSGPSSNGQLPNGQLPNSQLPNSQLPNSQLPNSQLPNSQSSNSGGSSPPPWPGRSLSAGSVPQAVVPSAQGVVYGSTGDTGLPNFYSARPTVTPAR